MQIYFISLTLISTLLIATNGQYPLTSSEEDLTYAPPSLIYPRSYFEQSDEVIGQNEDPYALEYGVRAKPITLYLAYARQGRGKKKGGSGYGWGKGGWWYYRDHKGCHSGTFGAPPGPGLEKEHYLNGACGHLGSHWKRQRPGHGHGHGHGHNLGHGGGHGYGHGGGQRYGHGGGHGYGHGGGHGGGHGYGHGGGQGYGHGGGHGGGGYRKGLSYGREMGNYGVTNLGHYYGQNYYGMGHHYGYGNGYSY